MSHDWADSLIWLSQNSPDPGVDYDTIYQKTDFSYPKKAYGVLSWWDYGHWITFLSQRIPITSPFQDNVKPVAQFLSSVTEKDADKECKEGQGKIHHH
jgi:dolichyl-diphosphooligosaccharide--protein glycosyltransferase